MYAHLAFRRVDNQARNVFITFYGNEAIMLPVNFPDMTITISIEDSTILFNPSGDTYNGLLGRGAQSNLVQKYAFAESILRSKSWTPRSIRRAEGIIWSIKPNKSGTWHVLCWLPIDNQVRLTMHDSIEKLIGELYE